MSANTWALTLVLHRTQRVADEAINRALDGILILAAFRFQNLFSTRETTPGSCNNTLRRPLRHGAQRPRTSGGRPAALRVTGDAARRLRYPSRAKRTKPTSRCRTVCTTPQCDQSRMPRLETRLRAIHGPHFSVHRTLLGFCGSPSAPSWQAPRACKRRKASSVTRHGRHRTSPALHVTRKTRSRRLAVAPLHHGAPRCDGCFTPRQTV